jgi:hypothetical protein
LQGGCEEHVVYERVNVWISATIENWVNSRITSQGEITSAIVYGKSIIVGKQFRKVRINRELRKI